MTDATTIRAVERQASAVSTNGSNLIRDQYFNPKSPPSLYMVELEAHGSDGKPLSGGVLSVSADVNCRIFANGRDFDIGPNKGANLVARPDGRLIVTMKNESLTAPVLMTSVAMANGGKQVSSDFHAYNRLAGREGHAVTGATMRKAGFLPDCSWQIVRYVEDQIARGVRALGGALAGNSRVYSSEPPHAEDYEDFPEEIWQPAYGWQLVLSDDPEAEFDLIPLNDPPKHVPDTTTHVFRTLEEMLAFELPDHYGAQARSIWSWLQALWDLINNLGRRLKKWIRTISDAAFKALKSIWSWVVSTVGTIMGKAKHIIGMFLRWLAKTIGLESIFLASRLMKYMSINFVENAARTIEGPLVDELHKKFQSVRKMIDDIDPDKMPRGSASENYKAATGKDLSSEMNSQQKQNPRADDNYVSDRVYWGANVALHGLGVNSDLPDPTRVVNNMKQAIKQLGKDFEKFRTDAARMLDDLMSDPSTFLSKALPDLVRLGLDILRLGIDLIELLVDAFLALVAWILKAISSIAQRALPFSIPFITDEYKRVTGSDLAGADIVFLITVGPFAALFQATTGKKIVSKEMVERMISQPYPWPKDWGGSAASVPAIPESHEFGFLRVLAQSGAVFAQARYDCSVEVKGLGNWSEFFVTRGFLASLGELAVVGWKFFANPAFHRPETELDKTVRYILIIDAFTATIPALNTLFTVRGVPEEESVELSHVLESAQYLIAAFIRVPFSIDAIGRATSDSEYGVPALLSLTFNDLRLVSRVFLGCAPGHAPVAAGVFGFCESVVSFLLPKV